MQVRIGHTGGLDYRLGDDGKPHLVAVEGDLTTVINIDNNDSTQENFEAIRRALTAYHLAPDSKITWVDCPDASLQALLMGMGQDVKDAPIPGWGDGKVTPQAEQVDAVTASAPEPEPQQDDEVDRSDEKPKPVKRVAKKATHHQAKPKAEDE